MNIGWIVFLVIVIAVLAAALVVTVSKLQHSRKGKPSQSQVTSGYHPANMATRDGKVIEAGGEYPNGMPFV